MQVRSCWRSYHCFSPSEHFQNLEHARLNIEIESHFSLFAGHPQSLVLATHSKRWRSIVGDVVEFFLNTGTLSIVHLLSGDPLLRRLLRVCGNTVAGWGKLMAAIDEK